jgi:hypothetical protein
MRKEYDFSKGKRGAIIAATGKTRITIMLDDDVIQHFRDRAEEQGTGYQTMINAALRETMNPSADRNKPITATALRKVIREEISMLRHGEKSS